MASFATAEDLATHVQRDFSAADTATATQALSVATEYIKTYVGQFIETVDNRTQVFRGTNLKVLILDQLPVRAVDSITVDTVAFTDFDADLNAGLITRNDYYGNTCWDAYERIVVTYDSGYTTIPVALKGICLQMAARLMADPQSWASESIGNYRRSGEGGAEGGFTTAEKRILDRFRA